MKKITLIFFSLCMAISSWGYDFSSGGIYYTTTDFHAPYTASVTHGSSMTNSYSGAVTIPSSVTDTATKITYSVTAIEELAFDSCCNLTSVIIPNSITYIHDLAFVNSSNLSSVNLPQSLVYLGTAAFSGCSKLSSITIPQQITEIKSETFMNCANLTTVNILSPLTTIGPGAFFYCSKLTSFTIPPTVTDINWLTFYGCDSLTDIYAYPTIPDSLSYEGNVFDSITPRICHLHVPSGSLAAYKAADVWKDFYITDDLPSSITNALASTEKVSVHNGQAVIAGTEAGTALNVYNLQGIAIYSGKTSGETQNIPLPTHGVYIVQLGGKSVKVIY